jgi:hypothetical protein
MEIQCQLTRSRYVKIILLMVVKSWSFYFFPALLIAAIILGSILNNYMYAIIIAAAFVLIYAFAIFSTTFSQRNSYFFQPVKYVFNDNDISVESQVSKKTLNWGVFVKWRKIADHYLLYPSSNNFLCIPRSAIPGRDVAGFEALLRSKIK